MNPSGTFQTIRTMCYCDAVQPEGQASPSAITRSLEIRVVFFGITAVIDRLAPLFVIHFLSDIRESNPCSHRAH
jgi:hypothetical protein